MNSTLIARTQAAPLGPITAKRPTFAADDPDVLGTPVVIFFGMFAAAVYTYGVVHG